MEGNPLEDSLMQGHPLECTICLDRMDDISILSTHPDYNGNTCDHWFCTHCIEPLVAKAKSENKKATCPSCRREILKVQKNRAATELIKEIEVQRQERKAAIQEKDAIAANLEKLLRKMEQSQNEAVERNQEQERLQQRCTQLEQQLQQEKSNAAIMRYQLGEETKKGAEIQSLKDKIRTLTEKNMELEEKLRVAESKAQEFQLVRAKNKELRKEVELKDQLAEKNGKLEAELLGKSQEIDKLRQTVARIQDELSKRAIQQIAQPPMIKSPSKEDGTLSSIGSWISPSLDTFKSSLSYFWNTRTGPLVKTMTDYTIIERRGGSRWSFVWKAVNKVDCKNVAIKMLGNTQINNNGDDTHNSIDRFRECMIVHKLDHNHIIKGQGVLRDSVIQGTYKGDFLLMAFVEFDLEYFLSNQQTALGIQQTQVRHVMYQLLSALYYIHSAQLIHRDIKPSSVLLDESYNIRLAGFVHARSTTSKTLSVLPVTRFTAPEVAMAPDKWVGLSVASRTACDIWSAGCIFAEMLAKGSPLFDSKDKHSLLHKICSISECAPGPSEASRFPFLNSIHVPKKVSLLDYMKTSKVELDVPTFELLKGMLTFEPDKRITAKDALEHSYFTKFNYVDNAHRTCPLANELTDEHVSRFIESMCGGL